MYKWITSAFLVSLVTACVTVTEDGATDSFHNIDAADARIQLGLGYLDAGDMAKARENLEAATKYAPDYYRALNSIAYYYQQVGENRLAEQAYKKALGESPKNGDVLNNYGVFLCGLGQYQKADKYFNRAIEQPFYYQVAGSYENAGICALKSGATDKAALYFQRSLDHQPGRFLSSLQLSALEVMKGEYKQARARLLKIHKEYGYTADSLDLAIQLETKVDNLRLAEKYTQKLKALYPDSKQYQKYKADEY
jgi:type IV pilus assembly protein PilF